MSFLITFLVGCLVLTCLPSRCDAATNHTLTIELLMVVDYSDYQYWWDRMPSGVDDHTREAQTKDQLKTHLVALLKSANIAYKSLQKYNISINIKLVDVLFMETAAQSPWTETTKYMYLNGSQEVVEATDVFKLFQPYADSLQATIPHDHAMLMSRYDIRNNATEALGVANLYAECSPRSVSIVQDGGFSTSNVIAHELGHSLGSEHDGDGNNCTSDDGYVMAVSQEVTYYNRWQFSVCSAAYIRQYIHNITIKHNNCMNRYQNHHPTDLTHNASWFGELYPADEQCKLFNGEHSTFCRERYEGNFTDVCRRFLCLGSSNNTCYSNTNGAGDGTPCGHNKWCMSNLCVHAPKPVLVTARTSSVNIGKQCREKYGAGSTICPWRYVYETDVSAVVCGNLYCSDPNNSSQCFVDPADDKTVCGNHKWCVTGKCVHSDNAPETLDKCGFLDVDGDVSDYNVTCAELVKPANQHLCYEKPVATTCCNTCHSIKRTNTTVCEYGDRSSDCLTSIPIHKTWCADARTANICCESCPKYTNTGRPGCEFGDTASDCATGFPRLCYDSKIHGLCCDSCEKAHTGPAGCEYGDKASWCATDIANSSIKTDCYKNADICCKSCPEAASHRSKDCPYGDHSHWCIANVANVTYKGSCYRNANFCCESCAKVFRADRLGCEYGDHNKDCPKDIAGHPGMCYDKTNLDLCCGSCLKHHNEAHHGCEYGDYFTDCDVHQCANYKPDTLKKCCDTCKDAAALVG